MWAWHGQRQIISISVSLCVFVSVCLSLSKHDWGIAAPGLPCGGSEVKRLENPGQSQAQLLGTGIFAVQILWK